MKYGITSLAEVINLLQQTDTVYCDLALFRNTESDRDWTAYRLFIDVAQGGKEPRSFNYGKVAFTRGSIDAAAVVKWLTVNQQGTLNGHHFVIPAVIDKVNWSRSSSHRRNTGYQRLTSYHSELPHSVYRISFKENPFDSLKLALNPDDSLIQVGCPTFPDYHTALTYLMHGAGRKRGEDALPSEIILRVVHNDAWIDEVTLGSNRVAVTVRGDQIAGTHLAAGCGGYYFEEDLEREVTLLCPTPSGTSNYIWIILSHQDKWLDGREIDLRYGADSFPWDNVKASPENAYEQIRGWTKEGESSTMEYKQQLSADERKVLKTVVAFANGQGGVILLGVDDDQAICGVEHEFPLGSLGKYKDKITDLIHAWLSPFPEYLLSHCVIGGHTVVALQVFEGRQVPYTLRGKDQAPVVYVRRNASTYAATPAEIREIVLKFAHDPSRFRLA
jgi:schlafen family protein